MSYSKKIIIHFHVNLFAEKSSKNFDSSGPRDFVLIWYPNFSYGFAQNLYRLQFLLLNLIYLVFWFLVRSCVVDLSMLKLSLICNIRDVLIWSALGVYRFEYKQLDRDCKNISLGNGRNSDFWRCTRFSRIISSVVVHPMH